MFEIYRRHNPMFVLSEIKLLAKILTDTLQFDRLNLDESSLHILDISQTVRINENNQFIMKSKLSVENVIKTLQENSTLQHLRNNQKNASLLIEKLLKHLVDQLAIDSHLYIGKNTPIPAFERAIPLPGKYSKKPLIVFNHPQQITYSQIDSQWFEMDHPALWIGQNWITAMEGTEAFFAMSPELKLETDLNRYQHLESFGNFAIGLVRF
jgi:hypothetical protein